MNKITIKTAMCDLREEFLARIFKNYPDHRKVWTAEDINDAFTSAMYDVACAYLDRIEKEGKNDEN